MLRGRLAGRRLIFTDAERRQLARKAVAVGWRGLFELEPIVTPDTLLRWHRSWWPANGPTSNAAARADPARTLRSRL
jgi:hypothetical protein